MKKFYFFLTFFVASLVFLPMNLVGVNTSETSSPLLSGSETSFEATVTTDKDDYYPGEYVRITGSGWLPGETVFFTFEETPKPATCVNSHDIFAIADADGNIYNDQFLIKENHIGVSFVLTAKGQLSNHIAVTTFTDGTWTLSPNH